MSKTQTPQNPSAADATRMALVMAALKLFGRQGFDGTSTREIATAANANIGSIAYHFGGKEGLHAATADHIVETIQKIAAQTLGNVHTAANSPPDAQVAQAQMFATLERMVGFFVVSSEAGDIARFMLRETSQPTSALDRIYHGVFEPLHKRLCQIWEQATGEPAESERTRLTVFTLIGQVVYFRIGREVVLKRMGWDGIGDKEAGQVLGAISVNLSALLAARKDANK